MKKYTKYLIVSVFIGVFAFTTSYAEDNNITSNKPSLIDNNKPKPTLYSPEKKQDGKEIQDLKEKVKEMVQNGEIVPPEAYKKLHEMKKKERKESYQEFKNLREDFRNRIQEENFNPVQAFRKKHEEMKKNQQERMGIFREQFKLKKEEGLAERKIKREEMKEKLKVMKEEKGLTVENIYDKFHKINTDKTDHFANIVDQIEEILLNVESRTDKAILNGKDITNVEVKITEAETVISTARDMIAEQASKVYEINVVDEETLREVVKEVRESLRTDLTEIKNSVKDAHIAVRDATISLAQIPNIDKLEVEIILEDNEKE
ncbi:MAG: hypothetical protein U9R00_00510 [Patescibacteria group bacterium]|nr:hypothetical protein [Patescibacteria group bacterium]